MQKEQGVTIMGALIGIVFFIVAAIFLMRIVPVYVKSYELHSSILALKQLDPSSFSSEPSLNVEVLKNKLMAQLEINDLDEIKPSDVQIKALENDTYQIQVKYQVIRPLFYNISLLFDFDELQEVHIASS
ncbi:DUF4845 domain-containing protein [Legionella sp. CNM-4043-24]|uniref:DUF4845 domain-containing protein n=1 Tax=Legionella sp. CNM-4043-24 TaxID=3421646 RepID=UPI00403B022F